MLFLINGHWMGLPIEAFPEEGTVRIGGCFETSMAEFLEAVIAVFRETPLRLDDARREALSRLQEATIEAREDGEYIVIPEAA